VLCAQNKIRQQINATIRSRLTDSWLPIVGDKLVCLKNDQGTRALLNGTLWIVDEILKRERQDAETGLYVVHSADDPTLITTIKVIDKMFKCDKDRLEIKENLEERNHVFDYGYALTVHKSQGSQWDNVVIFDDHWARGSDDHRRWMYTAITRAAVKVTYIKNIRM
jgi:ATP-dependent exoDNAse (exonuclease V) alpha subunit